MKKFRFTVPFIFLPGILLAQENRERPHWGLQGDIGGSSLKVSVFSSGLAVEAVASGWTYGIGFVRFNQKGNPNYSVVFSHSGFGLDGRVVSHGNFVNYDLNADAEINGIMVSKYANFFNRERWSAGLALGAGIGRLSFDYETVSRPGDFSENVTIGRGGLFVPLFEILFRVDVRLVRRFTVGPIAGFRNGTFLAGGSLRFNF